MIIPAKNSELQLEFTNIVNVWVGLYEVRISSNAFGLGSYPCESQVRISSNALGWFRIPLSHTQYM